jgi:hypothetical protein
MKTIDDYRKSCLTFVLIDAALFVLGIVVVTLFHSTISDISIFASRLTIPLSLGTILLLDSAALRFLIHVSVEIDETSRKRSMPLVRAVHDAQSLLHIMIIAAIAGIVVGKLGLFPQK